MLFEKKFGLMPVLSEQTKVKIELGKITIFQKYFTPTFYFILKEIQGVTC